MALDRLDALETRVKDLVKLIQELKKRNAGLEDDLRLTRQRLTDESDSNRRWARERTDIKARIEKVLSDIEGLNTTTPSRLAVLTALNLAHQLFEAEKKRTQGEADVERRMMSLMESIEEHVPTSLFR